ncbi:MAG: Acetyltransferase [Nocardioides sp.]|jgi:predicted acetyltransferase|uniref:GNAT family N-acetyltransferase n=1 Tax=Nocardioides sp. TaxID=35761 RepID=UPI00262EBFA7|nr:GNAT family N-acetyltransferase [Nocardioides sp.]MCW2832497.1 Acetyltransferase [Nocardioides sp.]
MTTGPRPLLADDIPQLLALGQEAFGAFPAGYTLPGPADYPAPGRHTWGTFDGDRLVAKVVRREYDSWFHGTQVPTNGIAGVAVSAEHRGAGLLDDLMAAVLDEGKRERGEAISTLFATAPGIYRRYGFELVTSYDTVEITTSRLAAVKPPESTTTRRATADDFGAVRRVYKTWASAQNGPLTRAGASFPADADEFIGSFTGVTLALAGDDVVGYASWNRGSGYGDTSTFEVADLVTLTGDATRALWRMIATFASVTGRVHLSTSGRDSARLALPFAGWQVVESEPYMLRIHDVPGAFTGLRLASPGVAVDGLAFGVEGDLLDTMNGHWSLSVDGGVSTCAAGPVGGPTFAPRGLSLLYAGAASCADLRMAGLLSGVQDRDRVWDSLFGGRQVHVRDYF